MSLGKLLGSRFASEVAKPLAAGVAGYAVAPYLQTPLGIKSELGKQTHSLGTAAVAAALASPRSGGLWKRDITAKALLQLQRGGSKVPVGSVPNVYHPTPLRGALTSAALAGAPSTLGYATDHTKQIAETAVKAIENNPDVVADPGKFVREQLVNPQVDRVIDAAKAQAPFLLTSLGTSLGGGVAGSGGGYLLGRGLGQALLPDNESLTYEQRRHRERLRGLLSGVSAYGGAIGGSYLANRFHPSLIKMLTE